MKKNLNAKGRLLRLAIALFLFALAYWKSSWIALGFGLFTLYESLMSWCIFNAIMGQNSCKR